MTQSDQTKCPRCGARVDIGPMYHQIKPHRDPIVRSACPTEGMTMPQAVEWVEAARRRIAEAAG